MAAALTKSGLDKYDDNTARGGQMVVHSSGPAAWSEGPGVLRATGGGGTEQGGHLVIDTVPEIVGQAVTSKWSKGSSGPAGDEHHNLLPVTAFPVTMRGRGDDTVLEVGEEGVYNALKAGDGGSSRQQLVALDMRNGIADGEVAHSLQAQHPSVNSVPHVMAVDLYNGAEDGEVTHTLRDGNGEGTPAVVSLRQNLDGEVFSDEVMAPLRSEATGAFNQATIGFHLLQDPTADTVDVASAMTAGSDRAGAQLGVAFRKAQKAHDPDDCERWEEADTVDTLSSHSTTSGSAVVQPEVFQCHGSNVGPMGTLRRGTGDVQGGVPFVGVEMAVRRLTPTECERLQGFPDGWTASRSDSARYRLLGNAVCVPVAAWIARRIIRFD